MGAGARLLEAGIVGWFRRQGWTVEGSPPEPRRCIIIAAPHTSNWDFLYFIGGTRELGLKASFMGKKQLFTWPFGGLMREMGGIPVDRSRSTNAVDAMIAEFARREEFMLTIAPEGTRGSVRAWKTGFYQIAMGAKVPMVCGLMDYARKVVGLGPAIWASGDYLADMERVRTFYSQCTPKYPQLGNPGPIADPAAMP
jgi:1-acyl-sn-glycerol-3-phosphate acyltransferase